MLLRFLQQSVLLLGILLFSLFIGVYFQNLEISSFVPLLGLLAVWLLLSILFGFSFKNNLIVISFFFLKPNMISYLFVLVLLVISLIFDFYFQNGLKIKIPFPKTLSILIFFGALALTKTYVSGGGLYFSAAVIVPVLTLICISSIEYNEDYFQIWTKAVSVIAVVVAVYGVIIAILNPYDRLGSFWTNAMTINGFYTAGFFFSIANAFRAKSPLARTVWIVFAVVIFLGIVYTYTRIALVAIIVGLLILMFKVRKFRLYGIVALGMVPLLIPSSMTQRLTESATFDLSLIIRLIVWYKAMGVILQHPLTGIGFSTWQDIYRGMIPTKIIYAIHAHNLAINLMLEMGIIGFLAYMTPIISTLSQYYRYVIKRSNGSLFYFSILVAMLALLFACITDIFIEQYPISILFWITIALMYNKIIHVKKSLTE